MIWKLIQKFIRRFEMATQDDVRRIALALPGAFEEERGFAFAVLNRGKRKGFAWIWLERIQPKKTRVPCPRVIAVRVADEAEKEMLLAADEEKFFTEPHYNGYPAVLVRLSAIGVDELTELITDAWRCQAPVALVAAYDEQQGADSL
jgi:hypothetical protein